MLAASPLWRCALGLRRLSSHLRSTSLFALSSTDSLCVPEHWASTLQSRSTWLHLMRRGWAAGQMDQCSWAQVPGLYGVLEQVPSWVLEQAPCAVP